MPSNVLCYGLGSYIKIFNNRLLSNEEIEQIMFKLNKHVAESKITTSDHINSLCARHSSNTNCPRCGGNLIEKTAKKGPSEGAKFLGCDNYPKCRFTKNIF